MDKVVYGVAASVLAFSIFKHATVPSFRSNKSKPKAAPPRSETPESDSSDYEDERYQLRKMLSEAQVEAIKAETHVKRLLEEKEKSTAYWDLIAKDKEKIEIELRSCRELLANRETERRETDGKCLALERENDELKSTTHYYQEEISAIRKEMHSTTASLKAESDYYSSLFVKALADKNSLKDEIKRVKESSEVALKETSARNLNLKSQLDFGLTELSHCKAELESWKKQCMNSVTEGALLVSERNSLRKQLASAEDSREITMKNVKKLGKELITVKGDKDRKITELENLLEANKCTIAKLESSIESGQYQNSCITALREDIKKKEAVIELFQKREVSFQANLSEKNARIKDLLTENSELEKIKCEALSLRSSLESAESEKGNIIAQLLETNKKTEELSKFLAQSRKQCEELKKAKLSLAETIGKMEQNLKKRQAVAEELEASIEDIKRDFSAKSAAADTAKQALLKEINSLSKELDKARKTSSGPAEKQMANLTAELEAKIREISTLKRTLNEVKLKSKLEEDTRCDQIRIESGKRLRQLQAMQRELEIKEAELKQAREQSLPTQRAVDEERSYECVVCLENRKDTTLMPCKHMCVCYKCSRKLAECPCCRRAIEQRIRVYT